MTRPQEGHRMRGGDLAVALGVVVAAGCRSGGRRRGRMPGWVGSGSGVVALDAHSGVAGVHGGVVSPRSVAPGLGGVGGRHAVAVDAGPQATGGTSDGNRKVLPMTDLAGGEAVTRGAGSPLGVEAVGPRGSPAWDRVVVAGGGETVDLGGAPGQVLPVAGPALVGRGHSIRGVGVHIGDGMGAGGGRGGSRSATTAPATTTQGDAQQEGCKEPSQSAPQTPLRGPVQAENDQGPEGWTPTRATTGLEGTFRR